VSQLLLLLLFFTALSTESHSDFPYRNSLFLGLSIKILLIPTADRPTFDVQLQDNLLCELQVPV